MNYNRGYCQLHSARNAWQEDKKAMTEKNCGCAKSNMKRNMSPLSADMRSKACKKDDKSLAMVYSPYQEWGNIYGPEKALCAGTLFSELDKPFEGYKTSGRCLYR